MIFDLSFHRTLRHACGIGRQPDHEYRSLSFLGFKRDRAVMFFHNAFCDVETEPRALGLVANGIFTSEEFILNKFLVCFGDADARIGDDNEERRLFGADLHSHASVRLCIFDGVVDDVLNGKLEL